MTSKVPINQDRLINGDEKEFKSLFDLLYVGMVQQATFYTNDFAVAEDVDIKKAVSDMEKDQVLDQYKFFIGTAQKMQKMPNLGTDADGTVTLKMTE